MQKKSKIIVGASVFIIFCISLMTFLWINSQSFKQETANLISKQVENILGTKININSLYIVSTNSAAIDDVEIYDKENELIGKQKKHLNKKISILSGIIVLAVVICFFGTYFFTGKLLNKDNLNNQNDDKTVYNNSNVLDDGIIVVLMNQGVVEKEQSISDFKKENSIVNDINEQFLVNFYEANGYNLESLEDSKLVFVKDGTTSVLLPNKYYLGEKDGYFAIYKTDNSGVPKIESEDDVYSNSRSISFLKGEDLEAIKNFKYCYDTKDEAIEKLTAFIS